MLIYFVCEAYNVCQQGCSQRGARGLEPPSQKSNPPWAPPNEMILIHRSMDSHHFESWSAPPLTPELPCRPLILKSLATPLCSGVTRGGRVAHPWKVLVEILEGSGKWGKNIRNREKREGREKKRRNGKRRGKGKRESGKWKGKEGKIVKGEDENLKGKVWKWAEAFFFSFACHLLRPLKFSNLAHLWLHTWIRAPVPLYVGAHH